MPKADLNPQQLEAVHTVEGPILIIAGAGSGKTRVITHRIVHLIASHTCRPDQILAVTFTNKAAQEMKSRVESHLNEGQMISSPLLSTFHSLAVRILRRNIDKLNGPYTRDFTIYDEDDQARLVRAILKDLSIDDKSLTPRQALSSISWAKNRGLSPIAYENQAEYVTERREKVAAVYKQYEPRLAKANAMDFDDLLIKVVDLLDKSGPTREYYHGRFRHVMIDEFQDTNHIQYDLARLIITGLPLSSKDKAIEQSHWSGRSLCVVGDLDQSIYSFRGSDFNIILGFQRDFPGTRTVRLEQNYRSTPVILDAANRVIEINEKRLPKELYSADPQAQGDKIRYYQSYDGEGEAAFAAEKIQEHLRHGQYSAVLYRTNAQSRLFEESLRRRGVPYNIVGGFSFYDRAEVKDIIAYLKLAMNPRDDMALSRVINEPPRGIGKATLDTLAQRQAAEGLSLWEAMPAVIEQRLVSPRSLSALRTFREIITGLIEKVLKEESLPDIVKAATLESGYVQALREEKTDQAEGRLLNIEELVNAAVEAERQNETLRDFVDHAALASDTDQYREDARVTLLTVHSAKGLEFPVVFMAGLEEGIFPHSRASSGDDLEEERRLCYVAITRAQKTLYITHAMKRWVFGDESLCEPSRFLNEIPRELIEDLSPGKNSWLGYADSFTEQQRSPGQSSAPAIKRTSSYQGKTYNSVDSVHEFFNKRKGASHRSGRSEPQSPSTTKEAGDFKVGLRVRHERYGSGVVTRCEGAGEDAKLTVTFPGYGPKKFVAKHAALEKVR